jgi:hypothetical protein
VETDKKTCYVGEPIVATYKIYSRLISQNKLSQDPAFSGFSVIYMPEEANENRPNEKLDGKEYNVLLVRKAQLYALQPGVISLESAEIESDIEFVKESYAKQLESAGRLFDNFASSVFPPDAIINERASLKSNPVNITVKPLPDINRPDSFKGAVGKFSIYAALQRPLIYTDEAGKLSVTITGSGNMQLLTAPDIEWPKGIESFEPKLTDNINSATVPVSGTKKFDYSFTVNDTGNYTIPAIRFSYFDPSSSTYQSISTAPLVFRVLKGNGRSAELAKADSEARPSFVNRIFYHRWWIIVFIAVLVFSGLIIWLLKERSHNRKLATIKQVQEVKDEDLLINKKLEVSAINQQNVFAETEKCLFKDDCVGFYGLLNAELKKYLSTKLAVDLPSINSNSISTLMDKKGIPNDIVLRLQSIMQQIEWQLYTPFEKNETMNVLYHEAHEIVQQINAYDF